MTGPPQKRQKREDYKRHQESVKSGDGGQIQLPKKKFYRQRAHANPFSDHSLVYPLTPQDMDWTSHFPAFTTSDERLDKQEMTADVEIADIGCGFGGLIVALSPVYPNTLMLGMELRNQVTDYVIQRVTALRLQNPPSDDHNHPGQYQNISALRSNTMKFLPNYFKHNQLTKIFLCFPDPHFKARKHKARIVSAQLNAEYGYVLRPGGKLYTITDVEELHQWMVKHFQGEEAGDVAELWERVGQDDLDNDPCVKIMSEATEESKKVTRNSGKKFIAVFRRRENPEWTE